jgi:hypothetical protein
LDGVTAECTKFGAVKIWSFHKFYFTSNGMKENWKLEGWVSSVSIVMGYGLDGCGIWVRFLRGTRDFSPLHSIWGHHPALF